MKACMSILLASALLVVTGAHVCAAGVQPKCPYRKNFVADTAETVTDTAQSTVRGTAEIAQASATDTVDAPATAIQAVKNTAHTALSGADKAIKSFTGQE